MDCVTGTSIPGNLSTTDVIRPLEWQRAAEQSKVELNMRQVFCYNV